MASANGTQYNQTHDDDRIPTTGHSGRLVYAKPQDLPSFPSLGLKRDASAAGAAASLGWANKKSPEPWRPGKSTSASTAALLANDYKMAGAWEPSATTAGAKAALLAHQSSRNTEPWRPTTSSAGSSAATQAFRTDRKAPGNTQPDDLQRQGSLVAAKGAMGPRRRSKSNPVPTESYPDETNAMANALRAATKAHGSSGRSATQLEDAGAVPYTNLPREMFTSQPPVKPETDEQNRADVLHASAVAMAKKMYVQQQKMLDQAQLAHDDPASPTGVKDGGQPMQFNNLQDAAYKLAQERLSKLHEEHLKNREYHEYYGNSKPQRRFTVRGKLRRRASSDGDLEDDEQRSREIRQQMSIFSSKLSQVDDQKRKQDRAALLAAAQRNVKAQMQGMDEKMYADTGKRPPPKLGDWQLKAHAAAQARSDERMGNHGKVDIGAGKFMEKDDIDAIAARKVQPVLDEINDKAEKDQARRTELKLEMEKRKEDEETAKARDREVHEINKKIRDQEKQAEKLKKDEERQQIKLKKEEEKAAKAEQKRLVKLEKQKEKGDHAHQQDEASSPQLQTQGNVPTPVQIPTEPFPKSDGEGSPGSKMKTWLKSRFSRPRTPKEADKGEQKGFIGGAALTGMETNNSNTSLENGSASVRAVAMAGRSTDGPGGDVSDGGRSSAHDIDPAEVSSMSESSDDEFSEAREGLGGLSPPRPLRDTGAGSRKSVSPIRDSKFQEMIE